MADRDNYRGYGSPSGRYYENREYDRGGAGRDRDERGGWWFGGNDRDNDRQRSYGAESYGRGRARSFGGDDNRGVDRDEGFFERAGREVRSWFSDDDDDRNRYGRDERPQSRYGGQDRGSGVGGMFGGDRDRDYDPRGPQTYRAEDRSGGRGGQYSSGGARYGATSDYGAGSSRNQYGAGSRSGSHPHDEHYGEWRSQQLNAFDRDYDEYRRENRDKFHSEFSSWRGQREQQRSSLRQVREHQEVVGSDGEKVGTVDKVAGDKIILTKNDPEAGGHHHSIPCAWIQSVDDKVTINKTAEQARKQWTDEENRRALFESEDNRRDDGPHILDRSFSGTYGN